MIFLYFFSSLSCLPSMGKFVDSLNVKLIGSWPFGSVWAVTMDTARNLVFVGSGEGVYIFDVTSPDAPLRLSDKIRTRGWVISLTYDEESQILYAACMEGGIEIWKVSDPASPFRLGRRILNKWVISVAPCGQYLYAVCWDTLLRIFDISDFKLTPVDSIFIPCWGTRLIVSGNYLYIQGTDFLGVWDISDPLTPVFLDSLRYFTFGYGMDKEKKYIYTTGNYNLYITDVSEPSSLLRISRVELNMWLDWDVNVEDTFAYVTSLSDGVFIVNVSDPSSPVNVGRYVEGHDSTYTGCFAYKNHLYLGAHYRGFEILEVSDPSSPTCIYFYDVPYSISALYKLGNYVYLGEEGRVWIIDVTSLTYPSYAGDFEVPGKVKDILYPGDYLYIAVYGEGVRIYDITDPVAPVWVSSIIDASTRYIESICIDSVYAYLALGSSGIHVYDISNPLLPFRIATADTRGKARDLCTGEGYLYVADGDSGVLIFDISVPESLKEVSACSVSYAHSLVLSNGYLYIAQLNDGWSIWKVEDPLNPACVFQDTTITGIRRIAVTDSFCYVAGDSGVYVYRIMQPESVFQVGYYKEKRIRRIEVEEPYLYVSTLTAALYIFKNLLIQGISKISSPSSFIVCSDFLELPEVKGKISLFDVCGRKIKEEYLHKKSRISLENVPSGVYFLTCGEGERKKVIRLIRVK
ncbi:hypothetical protein DRQ20_03750 [bacterium]|nr:MAG: hypothetical protein DRQ20_03750 [bacterium]